MATAVRHRADCDDVLVIERVHQLVDARLRAAPQCRHFARRDVPFAQAADVVIAATSEVHGIFFAIERHRHQAEMILAVVEQRLPRLAVAGAIPTPTVPKMPFQPSTLPRFSALRTSQAMPTG